MDLYSYISDMGRRRHLAHAVGTSPDWLWQIATRWKGKRPSARLAERIEIATKGAVSRYELLWPEAPPPVPEAPPEAKGAGHAV